MLKKTVDISFKTGRDRGKGKYTDAGWMMMMTIEIGKHDPVRRREVPTPR